eukprot:SAG11_NODE_1671_length_4486_cov_1.735127_3_plen_89_part_00
MCAYTCPCPETVAANPIDVCAGMWADSVVCFGQELSLHIVTMLLALNRQIPQYVELQRQRVYRQLTFNRGEYRVRRTRILPHSSAAGH